MSGHALCLAVCLATSLAGCATYSYEPKTVEGAQCKMRCSTSVGADLGGIPYMQKMNNCLQSCADIERLRAEGK